MGEICLGEGIYMIIIEKIAGLACTVRAVAGVQAVQVRWVVARAGAAAAGVAVDACSPRATYVWCCWR